MSKKLSNIFFILAIITTVYIFSQSMVSAEVSKEKSDIVVKIIKNLGIKETKNTTHTVRKVAHYIEFLLQGTALSLGFAMLKKYYNKIIYILFFGLATAVTDEYIQSFYKGRGSEVSDVLIDFSGTVTAVLIICIIYYFTKRMRSGKRE